MSIEILNKIKTVKQLDAALKKRLFYRGKPLDQNSLYLLGRILANVACEQAYYHKKDADIEFCELFKRFYRKNENRSIFGTEEGCAIFKCLSVYPYFNISITYTLRDYHFHLAAIDYESFYNSMIAEIEDDNLIHILVALIHDELNLYSRKFGYSR